MRIRVRIFRRDVSQAEFAKERKRAVFTPYDVCKLMTLLCLSTENLVSEISQKGYVTVSDSACGSGLFTLFL